MDESPKDSHNNLVQKKENYLLSIPDTIDVAEAAKDVAIWFIKYQKTQPEYQLDNYVCFHKDYKYAVYMHDSKFYFVSILRPKKFLGVESPMQIQIVTEILTDDLDDAYLEKSSIAGATLIRRDTESEKAFFKAITSYDELVLAEQKLKLQKKIKEDRDRFGSSAEYIKHKQEKEATEASKEAERKKAEEEAERLKATKEAERKKAEEEAERLKATKEAERKKAEEEAEKINNKKEQKKGLFQRFQDNREKKRKEKALKKRKKEKAKAARAKRRAEAEEKARAGQAKAEAEERRRWQLKWGAKLEKIFPTGRAHFENEKWVVKLLEAGVRPSAIIAVKEKHGCLNNHWLKPSEKKLAELPGVGKKTAILILRNS